MKECPTCTIRNLHVSMITDTEELDGDLVCTECKRSVVSGKVMGMMHKDSTPANPLNTQIGGDHYKNFQIQPIEFITKNKLSFLQGDIIKRICRYNLTGGKSIEDLEKIKHEVDLLISFEAKAMDRQIT